MTKKTAYGYLLLLLSTSIVFTDVAFAQISAKEIARTRDDSLKTSYVCVSEADAKSFTSLRVEKPNDFDGARVNVHYVMKTWEIKEVIVI